MKKYIFIGLVIFLLLAMMSGEDKNKKESVSNSTGNEAPKNTKVEEPAEEQKDQPTKESDAEYLLGIGYFPFNPIFNTSDVMSKIKETAHIAYIQRHWQEDQNPDKKDFFSTLKNDVSEARKKNLKVYIAFEILSVNRDKLELPSNLSGNFSSPAVRNAYIDMITRVTKEYEPDYFILNVEANMYKYQNNSDYAAFKTLSEEAYSAIKKANSKTKVGVSLLYSDYNNKGCFEQSDLERLKNDASDFSKIDIFAVSTYPMCFITPSQLPDNFLFDVANISSKPLFISETGWVSSGLPPIGSESNQAGFIKALGRSADFTSDNNKKVEAINYVGLIDPPKQICDAITQIYPSLSWYCNLSLIDLKGNPKPAFVEMKNLKTKIDDR